ncbi:MAG: hypothetical protein RLO50_05725 [Azospirillaceae bacterium]
MSEIGIVGPATAAPGAPLTPDVAAFLQSAVSILVAAGGPDGLPVMARAIACDPDAAAGEVRLLLRTADAAALLAAIDRGSPVAAMFSRPTTNRTLQVKAPSAVVEPPDPALLACHRQYFAGMAAELAGLGFDARFISCVVSDNGSTLAAVRLAVAEIFDQTPGPAAGSVKAV